MGFFSTNTDDFGEAIRQAQTLEDLGYAAALDIGAQYAAEQRRTSQREQLFATNFRQWVRPQAALSLSSSSSIAEPANA